VSEISNATQPGDDTMTTDEIIKAGKEMADNLRSQATDQIKGTKFSYLKDQARKKFDEADGIERFISWLTIETK
jgi:hypothetical protein